MTILVSKGYSLRLSRPIARRVDEIHLVYNRDQRPCERPSHSVASVFMGGIHNGQLFQLLN